MKVVSQLSFFFVVFALSCTHVKKENVTTRIDSLWDAPDTANMPNDLTLFISALKRLWILFLTE
jgi:hypothetical protein